MGRDGTSPSGVALLRSRWRSEGILSRNLKGHGLESGEGGAGSGSRHSFDRLSFLQDQSRTRSPTENKNAGDDHARISLGGDRGWDDTVFPKNKIRSNEIA